LQTGPNATVATAQISGSTITVTGVAPGQTSVVIKDSSSPAGTVSVPISINLTLTDPALLVSSSNVSVRSGSLSSVTISGGTGPYDIAVQPDSTIATAQISGNTLMVTGVAGGTTSVTLEDSFLPQQNITVNITNVSSAQ
jgi:hypothetical protein